MPYPEDKSIVCPNCGNELIVPLGVTEERFKCQFCNHVIFVKIVDEGKQLPDPRHLC